MDMGRLVTITRVEEKAMRPTLRTVGINRLAPALLLGLDQLLRGGNERGPAQTSLLTSYARGLGETIGWPKVVIGAPLDNPRIEAEVSR
jgi:hypothetical protein